MWYVLSTPNPDDPEQETLWECPDNWIINNILHYPEAGTKSKRTLLDRIKKKEEPQASWVKTSIYKFIKNSEGGSIFGKHL